MQRTILPFARVSAREACSRVRGLRALSCLWSKQTN